MFGLAAGYGPKIFAVPSLWQNIRRTVWVNTYRAASYTTPFGAINVVTYELGQEAIWVLPNQSVWISTAEEMANPLLWDEYYFEFFDKFVINGVGSNMKFVNHPVQLFQLFC